MLWKSYCGLYNKFKSYYSQKIKKYNKMIKIQFSVFRRAIQISFEQKLEALTEKVPSNKNVN